MERLGSWLPPFTTKPNSRELGLVVKGGNHKPRPSTLTLTDALSLYQRLKGTNKTKLFFEASDRSIRYLADCLGHEQLDEITSKDAGRFRDYLFDRGMSSSSINRIFSTVRAVINLSIKEHGLDWSNVFSGTYIPDDSRSAGRIPILLINYVKFKKSVLKWMIRAAG